MKSLSAMGVPLNAIFIIHNWVECSNFINILTRTDCFKPFSHGDHSARCNCKEGTNRCYHGKYFCMLRESWPTVTAQSDRKSKNVNQLYFLELMELIVAFVLALLSVNSKQYFFSWTLPCGKMYEILRLFYLCSYKRRFSIWQCKS